MFISEALAETAGTTEALPEGSAMKLIIQFVLIFAIFYFILIRPQTKKMKEHKEKMQKVTVGEKVIISGIFGRVVKIVSDAEVDIEIASGVEIRVLKDAINEIVSNTPANDSNKPNGKGKKNAKSVKIQDKTESKSQTDKKVDEKAEKLKKMLSDEAKKDN